MSWTAAVWKSWVPSRSNGLFFVLGLPSILFFQTSVHELTHCALATITGDGCVKVAPFPSAVEHSVGMGVTTTVSDPPGVVAIGAATVGAFLLILVLRALAPHVRDRRLALLTRVWLFGAAVDLFANTISAVGVPIGGDWAWVADRFGWSRWQHLALTLPAWGVALGAVLTPIGPSSSSVAERTLTRREFAHVAAVYGAVSLAAVITYLSVGWSEIDRQPQLYWVALALQAATVTWSVWFVARYRTGFAGHGR